MPPIPRRTRVLDSDRAVRAFLEYAATVIPIDRPQSREQVLAEAAARVAAEPPPERDTHRDESDSYRTLRRQGRCVRCKARCSRSVCRACAAKQRDATRARIASGLCVSCGKPSDGKRLCARCREKRRQAMRERGAE